MNILICLIWMNIMTQVPIIGKNIIFKEYHKIKRKRGSSNTEETSTAVEETSVKLTQQSTTVTTPVPKDVSRILIEGPIEEIASIPLEQLVAALELLNDIEIVPENHIMEVWNVLKGNKSRESLSLEDIMKINGYLTGIPDTDLFYLNMSNWDLVEYLGKLKKFEKHEVAILAASLIKTHGFGILNNHSCINRMYGIICGFEPNLVKNIPDKEFLQINGEIFENLHACSQSQKRVFLEKATKPTIFGPPQVWNAETVHKANMLILAMKPRELLSLRPPAMEGIKPSILKMMSMELIMALNRKQIAFLSTEAFLTYKERIFLSSKQVYHKPNISCNILLLVSFLLYLEQVR